jgi:hypothetical protein
VEPDDALPPEMRWLPGSPPAGRHPLDAATAERMLAGSLDPADAPPGYADVARVLAAATRSASEEELAGEAAALAAFRASRRPAHRRSRRSPVLGKLIGAKAIVAALAGTITIGTAAAAATGALPDPAQRVAHGLLGGLGVPEAASDAAQQGAGASQDRASDELPGAVGLCRAWAAGQGGEHGRKLESTAFERLAEAAGGADNVAAFCDALATVEPTAGSGATGRGAPESPGAGRPSTPGATPSASEAALTGLCRAWAAAEDPAELGTRVRDQLAAAAGGVEEIDAFCADRLATTADQRGGPTATPSHPGGKPDSPPTTPRP